MPLKICIYAISKNEEQFVDRFIDAAQDADLILLADTGSTDKTVELFSARPKTIVHHISIKPWRFDHARNAALCLIPNDVDVCVSLDLDEILQPGWRAELERVWLAGKTTRLSYLFDWGWGIAFWYEKIHARHGYYWHHPCHEYPMPDGRVPEVWAKTSPDFLMVIHKPDSTKSRGQYLDLLKLSVTEDPHCPRNAFYYARELINYNQLDEGLQEVERYLALPRATWVNERCYAHRMAGRAWALKGDHERAYGSFMMAAKEAPDTREPWYELSKCCYTQAKWMECFAFANRCLSIPVERREKVYTVDPVVWGFDPHLLASISAWNLELWDIAMSQCEIALKMAPDDILLQNNYKHMKIGVEHQRCLALNKLEASLLAKKTEAPSDL